MEEVAYYFRNKCRENNLVSTILMTTNGAWKNELLPRVLDCVDEIIVSLDGPKEMHEKYRKCKGENSVFDIIVKNSMAINKARKLKHISSVITHDAIIFSKQYIKFFIDLFLGSVIKTAAVIVTGDAITNGIEKVSLADWDTFISEIKSIADGKITIIDSKLEKKTEYMYTYGCEHMRMTNWFCWLDGKILCCTDRENSKYYFGYVENHILKLNYEFMNGLKIYNDVENLDKCSECIAKYYCYGGCPHFRDGKLNCERRVEKYARMFIQKAKMQ